MGDARIRLTDENHRKLNILCKLYNKTQDEIINKLLERVRIPGEDIEFLVADEQPEIVKPKKEFVIQENVEFLEE